MGDNTGDNGDNGDNGDGGGDYNNDDEDAYQIDYY